MSLRELVILKTFSRIKDVAFIDYCVKCLFVSCNWWKVWMPEYRIWMDCFVNRQLNLEATCFSAKTLYARGRTSGITNARGRDAPTFDVVSIVETSLSCNNVTSVLPVLLTNEAIINGETCSKPSTVKFKTIPFKVFIYNEMLFYLF